MKNWKKRGITVMKFLIGATISGALVISVPLFTQKTFDPNSVTSKKTIHGRFAPGFVPLKTSEKSSIPDDPSNMIRHRGLPRSVDLSGSMPPVGSQGRQGSCVGWASGYGMKSYHEKVERRWSYGSHVQRRGPGKHVFSPAFIYNQINNGRDKGSSPYSALRLLQRKGVAPWKSMPYTDKNYTRRPNSAAFRAATPYKIKSYSTLRTYNAMKSQMAAGRVVLAGIKVYSNFYRLGSKVYESGQGSFRGGHAILLVGYDDSKGSNGAFKIFNSWGTGWGNKGYGWISYRGWTKLGLGAFGVYDEKGTKPAPGKKDDPPIPSDPNNVVTKVKAPSRVTASSGSYSNKVYLSWTRVKDAAAYSVQRAEPGQNNFNQIGYAKQSYFSDNKVQPDVAYRYRIISVGANNRSAPSYIVEGFAKKQASTRPPKVAGLEISLDSRRRVKIAWNRASGASSYQIIRWNFARKRWQYLIRRTSSTSGTDRRPIANSKNYYRVRAKNSSGYGKWSAAAFVNVGGRDTKPSKVLGLTATKGKYTDRVVLSWNRVSSARGYYVFRYDQKKNKWEGPAKARKTRFYDKHKSVKSGRRFGYIVTAYNSAGPGEFSKAVLGFARAGQYRGVVLNAPKKLVGKINKRKGTITLSWRKVKGASNYYIFRKKSGGKYKYIASSGSGRKTRYTEKLPGDRGILYLYVVRAKSKMGGESINSNAVSGFLNRERMVVRHRFMFNDGFKKFKGKWSATDWDGESAPKKMMLNLKKSGNNFRATFQIGEGRVRVFKGTYAAKSKTLVTDDGFKMQLVEESGEAGDVEIESSGGIDNIKVSFLKER